MSQARAKNRRQQNKRSKNFAQRHPIATTYVGLLAARRGVEAGARTYRKTGQARQNIKFDMNNAKAKLKSPSFERRSNKSSNGGRSSVINTHKYSAGRHEGPGLFHTQRSTQSSMYPNAMGGRTMSHQSSTHFSVNTRRAGKYAAGAAAVGGAGYVGYKAYQSHQAKKTAARSTTKVNGRVGGRAKRF